MRFAYKTDVGTFTIAPDRSGYWTLFIGSEGLGSYATPEMAADDVFMCESGHWEWDRRLIVYHPCDLSEWTQLY
ncbi:MAG: hypothetical protein FWG59_03370 [Betaproteobacteria bacterium]|nr:hypothetical protein [Betaproteobacteria bacterium]